MTAFIVKQNPPVPSEDLLSLSPAQTPAVSTARNGNTFVSLHACGRHHDRRLACPGIAALPDRFIVQVTPEDIFWGKPCAADQDAIALAVRRTLHELGAQHVIVTVGTQDVHIVVDWATPTQIYAHDAADLVSRFDAFEPVEPQHVTLTRIA